MFYADELRKIEKNTMERLLGYTRPGFLVFNNFHLFVRKVQTDFFSFNVKGKTKLNAWEQCNKRDTFSETVAGTSIYTINPRDYLHEAALTNEMLTFDLTGSQ